MSEQELRNELYHDYMNGLSPTDVNRMVERFYRYTSAKDSEIETWKNGCHNQERLKLKMKTTADRLIRERDAEIDRLQTALNRTIKQATEAIDEVNALKDDNERMREGIAKVSIDCKARETSLNWAHLSLEALLSPADGDGVDERKALKERYAALSEKIEALGECHDSHILEGMKAKISARLDEIGWNAQ